MGPSSGSNVASKTTEQGSIPCGPAAGISFNGRTAGLQPADEGSIPSISTMPMSVGRRSLWYSDRPGSTPGVGSVPACSRRHRALVALENGFDSHNRLRANEVGIDDVAGDSL